MSDSEGITANIVVLEQGDVSEEEDEPHPHRRDPYSHLPILKAELSAKERCHSESSTSTLCNSPRNSPQVARTKSKQLAETNTESDAVPGIALNDEVRKSSGIFPAEAVPADYSRTGPTEVISTDPPQIVRAGPSEDTVKGSSPVPGIVTPEYVMPADSPSSVSAGHPVLSPAEIVQADLSGNGIFPADQPENGADLPKNGIVPVDPTENGIVPVDLPENGIVPVDPSENGIAPANGKNIPADPHEVKKADSPTPRIAPLKDEITIVLVGKSGAGKSTLAKKFFGIDLDTKMSAKDKSPKIETHPAPRKLTDVTVRIVDTIGLGAEKDNKAQLKKLSSETKGKTDLVIYCLPIGPGCRFADSNPDIMASLQAAYGKEIWKHCIVVLTYSNMAWLSIKLSQPDEAEAIAEYKHLVSEYVQEFRKQLEKLGVKEVITESILDAKNSSRRAAATEGLLQRTTEGSSQKANDNYHMLFIPVGHQPNDPVMADVKCTVTAKYGGGGQDVPQDKRIDTNKWADVLTYCILEREEVGPALLQFWYGRDRIEQVMREGGYFNTFLGGGFTGMVAGGAAGTATGAAVGALGGPFGLQQYQLVLV